VGKTFANWWTAEIPLRQRFVVNAIGGFFLGLAVAAVHDIKAFYISLPPAFAFLTWFSTFKWFPRSLSIYKTPRAILILWFFITLGFFVFLFFAA
jgi:hypothetical protein